GVEHRARGAEAEGDRAEHEGGDDQGGGADHGSTSGAGPDGSAVASGPLPRTSSSASSAPSTGMPDGRNGVSAKAIAAPTSATVRVCRSRRAGITSASSTAGKAASRPHASVSSSPWPSNAPTRAPAFQKVKSVAPQVKKVSRRRSGSV